jgi:regulator of extracellular matrix RemA (YlzA/DUF370 family)
LTSAAVLTVANAHVNNVLTIDASGAGRANTLIGRVALRHTRAIVHTRLRHAHVHPALTPETVEARLTRAIVVIGARARTRAAVQTRTGNTLIDGETAVEARVA